MKNNKPWFILLIIWGIMAYSYYFYLIFYLGIDEKVVIKENRFYLLLSIILFYYLNLLINKISAKRI